MYPLPTGSLQVPGGFVVAPLPSQQQQQQQQQPPTAISSSPAPVPLSTQAALSGARAALEAKAREAAQALAAAPLHADTDAAGLERVRALVAIVGDVASALERIARMGGAGGAAL